MNPNKMRIIIITQDDPFYLAENLDYLLSRMPAFAQVVGCVVSDVSPFGRKESFTAKAFKTWRIFGTVFFLRYAWRFVLAKLPLDNSLLAVLKAHGVERIKMAGSLNNESTLARLREAQPDLLISIAGNEIFKKALIELAPLGCLNLHTALLPKYRGLLPSFWVLKNQEKETGVTVFFVDEGIDSGPILVQKRLTIGNLNQDQLIKRSKRMGMEVIITAIEMIEAGQYELKENDDSKKSYFSFPTRRDVKEFRRNGGRFY